MSRRFAQLRSRLVTAISLTSILGLALCLLLIVGIGWLCEEVWERETFQFDAATLLWLHQWASPGLDRVMLSITNLGDPEVVIPVVIGVLSLFAWKRRWLESLMLIIACAGAIALNQGLKLVFTRPRPTLWTPLIKETSYSFPSGHALGSLVLYGFLAYVFARWYPRHAHWIYGLAVILISLIGLSRLYLGVHFPTDIVAGYSMGFLWLMLCVVMLNAAATRLAGGEHKELSDRSNLPE